MAETSKSVAYISLNQFENQPSVSSFTFNNSDPVTASETQCNTALPPEPENVQNYHTVEEDMEHICWQSASSTVAQQVTDKFNFVYVSLVLSGVGFLLPYNSFVNAVDYYGSKYGPSSIMFDFTTTYITVMLITVLINNVFVKLVSFRMRISAGYVLAFVALSFLTYFDVYLEWFSRGTSYRLTLVAAAVVSLGCTAQQSSFYGYASMLPRRFTQAVMSGESISGVLASSLRLVSEVLFPGNPTIFFVMSCILLLTCFMIFHISVRTQFVRCHLGRLDAPNPSRINLPKHAREENFNLGFLDEESANRAEALQSQLSEEPPEAVIEPDIDSTDEGDNRLSSDSQLPDILESLECGRQKHHWMGDLVDCINARWTVTRQIWTKMLAIGLAYLVTLSVFPGIETEIQSREWPKLIPIILIFVFNLSDLMGKLLAAIHINWSGKTLIIGAVSRSVLVPMLMMCAAPKFDQKFSVDSVSIAVTSVLGITNGYFGSVPMILAPLQLQTQSERELAGNCRDGVSIWLILLVGISFSYKE